MVSARRRDDLDGSGEARLLVAFASARSCDDCGSGGEGHLLVVVGASARRRDGSGGVFLEFCPLRLKMTYQQRSRESINFFDDFG